MIIAYKKINLKLIIMAKKTIVIEKTHIKTLLELMDRGLAYTDAYFRDYKRMEKVFNEINEQI